MLYYYFSFFIEFDFQRHAINRQLALNTLAAMHRRFSLPSIISTNGRPLAEFRASANKSLDILRQNIQAAVTKEIDQVIKKYLEVLYLLQSVLIIISCTLNFN